MGDNNAISLKQLVDFTWRLNRILFEELVKNLYFSVEGLINFIGIYHWQMNFRFAFHEIKMTSKPYHLRMSYYVFTYIHQNLFAKLVEYESDLNYNKTLFHWLTYTKSVNTKHVFLSLHYAHQQISNKWIIVTEYHTTMSINRNLKQINSTDK